MIYIFLYCFLQQVPRLCLCPARVKVIRFQGRFWYLNILCLWVARMLTTDRTNIVPSLTCIFVFISILLSARIVSSLSGHSKEDRIKAKVNPMLLLYLTHCIRLSVNREIALYSTFRTIKLLFL